MGDTSHPTFGNGKICYIEIPARDLQQSSDFYKAVFNWQVSFRPDGSITFDDSVREVSGTWVLNRTPNNDSGLMLHIMVDDIQTTITLIETNGGQLVQPVGAYLPEITAKFKDPAGNIFGLYQQRL